MEEKRRSSRSMIKDAIATYNAENPETPIEAPVFKKNWTPAALWDKLGKTGQVITLVVTIVTGVATLKPYVVDGWNFMRSLIYAVENVEKNSESIEQLKKYDEVTSSIMKLSMNATEHVNPDGTKVRLYQTKKINGQSQTYYFAPTGIFYAANLDVDKQMWYYIDSKGDYHAITE